MDRSIEVDADLFRLAQVFSNLLNNAAKFSHRGSSISVSIEYPFDVRRSFRALSSASTYSSLTMCAAFV